MASNETVVNNVNDENSDTLITDEPSAAIPESSRHPTIEKLRIVIPAGMSSPYHSSSSDSNSPIRTKKNRKRFCVTCDIRFKHKADWLRHLERHVSVPSVILTRLDESNAFYRNYLVRASKRRLSEDTESLKIKLKIPRTEASNQTTTAENKNTMASTPQTSSLPAASPPILANECRIRVLRADEIKPSSSPAPMRINVPSNAMVSLPPDSNVHFECPVLDGLCQFAEDAMNEESTAQILKQLLEAPNEPTDTSEWDSNPNEFISIDRLAHTCKVCNEKYPDLHFLQAHQRLTGHGSMDSMSASVIEPIQEMIVEPMNMYQAPQTSQLEHLLVQPKNVQPQRYAQHPGLPIHQMESQVRQFAKLNQMANRPRHALPMRMPLNHSMQLPTQQPMMRPSNLSTNQPLNMTPFLEMNPDMYNPRQPNNMPFNGMNSFNRSPHQMMSRFMTPPEQIMSFPTHSPSARPNGMMMRPEPCFSMPISKTPPQQSQRAQVAVQRPPATIQRPPMLRSAIPAQRPLMPNQRTLVPPQRHQMMRPLMQQQRPPMLMRMPVPPLRSALLSQRPPMPEQAKKLLGRSIEIENQPIITNAPRTEGLPVIESVQSAGFTHNTLKKPLEPPKTIQINDQITLSVKNKEPTVKMPEKRTTPPITDSNKVANILANRGITVKSTTRSVEKVNVIDDSNKTPYASAEAAVQKLQMNSSVSIISKKKVTNAIDNKAAETIDLSNDDDATDTFKKPAVPPPMKIKALSLKCSHCKTTYTDAKSLRKHTEKMHPDHAKKLYKYKCIICLLRFPTCESAREHLIKFHPKHRKPKLHQYGIPLINFQDAEVRNKMASLGFTSYLPVTNIKGTNCSLYGMPIVNINGPSFENFMNIFKNKSTKLLTVSNLRHIDSSKPSKSSTSKASSTQSFVPQFEECILSPSETSISSISSTSTTPTSTIITPASTHKLPVDLQLSVDDDCTLISLPVVVSKARK